MKKVAFFGLLILILGGVISAESTQTPPRILPVLVKEINTNTQDSNPHTFTVMDDVAYFYVHSTSLNGFWRSDGSAEGTYPLAPQLAVELPNVGGPPTELDGVLYFVATDTQHGDELWRTDGSISGTYLLHDIAPGRQGSFPESFVRFHDYLYFVARTATGEIELHRTDGTTIEQLTAETSFGYPRGLIVYNNRLYFHRAIGDYDALFYLTESANLIHDVIYPSMHDDRVIFNGELYYIAAKNEGGHVKLFRTDGQDHHEVGGDAAPRRVSNLRLIDDQLFFEADGASLWVTDGTDAGTRPVAALDSAAFRYEGQLTGLNGKLFFVAERAAQERYDNEVWVSDGTAAGTHVLKEINPNGAAYPTIFATIDGYIYFSADDGNGFAPWVSDGTTAGTHRMDDNSPHALHFGRDFTKFGELILFNGATAEFGNEPSLFDPVTKEVSLLQDINLASVGSNPAHLTVGEDVIYFAASDGNGLLWQSDGTSVGTHPVSDIGLYYSPQLLYNHDQLYFVAKDQALSTLDPHSGNVQQISDATTYNPPYALHPVGDTVIFVTTNMQGQPFLFRTNGTVDGTIPILPAPIVETSRALSRLQSLGERLYFTLHDSAAAIQLLSTDVTDGNLVIEGEFITIHTQLIPFNNGLYFVAKDVDGVALWRIDGGGLQKAATFPNNGAATLHAEPLVAGALLYLPIMGEAGLMLWVSDGTNLSPVKTFGTPYSYYDMRELVEFESMLYFEADGNLGDDQHTPQLWVSDGTETGTAAVTEINHERGSSPREMQVAGNWLYFSADDGTHGYELWRTNGTLTERVSDINPTGHAAPHQLTLLNSQLFFVAENEPFNRELYRLPLSDLFVHHSYLPIAHR